jgi:hypothetical protein
MEANEVVDAVGVHAAHKQVPVLLKGGVVVDVARLVDRNVVPALLERVRHQGRPTMTMTMLNRTMPKSLTKRRNTNQPRNRVMRKRESWTKPWSLRKTRR